MHVHTEYSLLDGAAKVDDLIEHMVKNGIDCCAVTDHGNMYASLYFAEECVKKGLKYIIGCELYATDNYLDKRPGTKTEHIIVLAKNKTGYKISSSWIPFPISTDSTASRASITNCSKSTTKG